jgi:hypothetical protein
MHRDVGAVVEGLQQDRRRDRVVDQQRHAMAVRDLRQRLDIADIAGGISDGLGEHRLGVLVDQFFDRVRLVAFGETAGDALPRQYMSKQRIRRAVELRNGNDIAAAIGEIDEREMQRRLTARDRERADAAFEFGDALFEHSGGGVGDPAIAKAFGFQIEQGGAVIGAVEGIGDGLVNRDGDRLGRGIGIVAGVNGDRLIAHRQTSHVASAPFGAVLRHARDNGEV